MTPASRLAIATVLLAIGLLGLPAVAPAAIVSCGQVITATIVVENDLADCPAAGLVVGAPGIIVDLGGHTIAGGASATRGIDVSGFNGVVVRNGTVIDFPADVRVSGARNTQLRDLTTARWAT